MLAVLEWRTKEMKSPPSYPFIPSLSVLNHTIFSSLYQPILQLPTAPLIVIAM